MQKKKSIALRQIIFSAIALALATVLSFVKLFSMPMGGSITLLSMFFVCIIGYWYGPKVSFLAAFAYGLLQLAIEPYILSPLQLICDYGLAFTALGLSGLFYKKKFGLQIGYLVGVFGRFVFAVLSGVLFFADYTPPEFSSPLIYSVAYNGAYLGVEAAITLVIIFIPPVYKGLAKLKSIALSQS
ncbi:MAG: energy-coupled thiamine transporter ThiT [Parasporobacterium sp.]|nr:energy-coupled thiamine transporter ThiT [Parasporobacterium sp.]